MAAPFYAAEIAALETALGSGELTIESEGQRITYRSSTEIIDAISYFKSLAASASTCGSGRTTLAAFAQE